MNDSSAGAAARGTQTPRIAIVDSDTLFVDAVTPRLLSIGMVVQPDPRSTEGQVSPPPDVVLVDADGGHEDDTEWVLHHLPDAKTIIMSSRLDEAGVRRALQQGFHGAISKDIAVQRFQSAILSVLEGDVVVEVKPGRHRWESENKVASVPPIPLTERERQVLELLVDGASSADMADRLSLSPHTVRTHVQNVMTKLQVHSRVEAAGFAVRNGLVDRKDA